MEDVIVQNATPKPEVAPTSPIAVVPVKSVPPKPGITLTWKPSPTTGVTGHSIYRAESVNGPYTRIKTIDGNQTSYTDRSADPMKTYFYTVTVSSPGGESIKSNQVSETMPEPGMEAPHRVPQPPSQLTVALS